MVHKRELFNFNSDWKFHDGDITKHNINTVHAQFERPEYVKAGNHGLAYASYDDSNWETVQIPHDFVIRRNVFDDSVPSCTGSMKKGIVWYRRSFFIPEEDRNRRLFVQFDGIYRNSEVWLNGNLVGRHIGGYMGFEFEITELIHYDKVNSFAIKVDVSEFEGWWYEGGGIYRDVRLLKTDQIRVMDQEVHIETTDISVEDKTASIVVHGAIDCGYIEDDYITVDVQLKPPSKDTCGSKTTDSNTSTLASKSIQLKAKTFQQAAFTLDFDLTDIQLWDIDQPQLYSVVITARCEAMQDHHCARFGLRTIKYSAEHGFELNGRTVKIKGVNGHDDFACVGVALTRPIMQFKIDKLREMGANAYRCSHNPPNPKFLDYCDEVGMLVMDETRLSGVNEDDLGDYVAMIKRDRNHPSIIAWSMGNEEMAIHATEVGVQIYKKMIAIGQLYDHSRPFLYAINADYDRIVTFDRNHDLMMNPVGLNYFVPHDDNILETMHQQYPDLCMINSETTGMCSTRAFVLPKEDMGLVSKEYDKISRWKNEKYKYKITCYGSNEPVWGMDPETSWKVHVNKPYSAGVFLWTGFDYRGEVFPFHYPAVISFYGIIDLCGFEKDWFYYMQSNWTDRDVLHLLPHWNLDLETGENVDVWAFTNCDEVELFINGVSQGRKTCEQYGHLEWSVSYEPGKLEAIGYRDGIEIMRDYKVTAGTPETLVLTPNKTSLLADNEDAVLVSAHLEDSEGNMVMTSSEMINFAFDGPCVFLGTGNGDHFGNESDIEPQRTLFVGKCLVAVQSTYEAGEIKVTGHWNDQEVTVMITSNETNYMPIIETATSNETINRPKAHADGGI
ncbi:glycoside hydrolase family 2 protein [Vallitalea pronyensis]|uniref:Glycoside hydrolase family 2 protein n=1 Tax=Vallitalea pronyensis TaxID=1348613 RepID=A0A8J8SI43_9FIRM|nr:glycoside hydrolase family 2 TIM barrel-domain containing protein [Vallitalea pronyensis]QUI24221.1 glycoside hydrolase family 2 protein [Vallitalea pronyensis]